MTTGTFCDHCKRKIENDIYYRKHYEEEFCSRQCLIEFVIENLDIRTKGVADR